MQNDEKVRETRNITLTVINLFISHGTFVHGIMCSVVPKSTFDTFLDITLLIIR